MSARRLTRSQMVATVVLAAILWAVAALAGAWWFRQHWLSVVSVQDQALGLSLPRGLKAGADVRSTVHTTLKARPRVVVPLDQTVSVSLPETLQGATRIETAVPVDTEVSYAANVPVATEVTLKVPVVSWLPSMTVTLPLAFSVPVQVTVPFKANLPIALDLKVAASVPDALRLPLKTRMSLDVPLHQALAVQVLSRTQFELLAGIDQMPVTISQAALRMPLAHLSLQPTTGAWLHQAGF